MQNLERMRELIQTIQEADEAYYKYDAPIMADLDYDRLYDELAALERETGTILSSSPTQRVSGEVLESLTTVRHTRPMLSADKCKSVADIHKYLGGHEAVLSWSCAMKTGNWHRRLPGAMACRARMSPTRCAL